MRVLHIITFLSDAGGAEKLMESLLPEIASNNVEVSVAVLCLLDSKNEQIIREHGIEIIKVGRGGFLYDPIKMFKLIRIMRRFDIVHTHLTAPFVFAAFNKRLCKAKLVNTIHNTDSKCRHYPLFRQMELWALNKYDYLVACSKEAEDSLRHFMGKTTKRITTISNGIDLKKFQNATPSPEFTIPTQKNITMVAIFRKQKDQNTLIRATKLLPRDYHTYFIGWGDIMVESEKLAKEFGIEERVHFLGKRTDVPNILKASDFIVLSSHYEGLSLASIEAMASGAPFIASDVPGLHDLVNGYGVLFEEGNAEALAGEIMRLSADHDAYKRVSEQCQGRAAEFDIATTAKSYVEIYKELLR